MKYCKFLMLVVFLLNTKFALAAGLSTLEVIPTSWKLEDYMGGQVFVWFSESSCVNGQLQFPAHATSEDKNRFWSVVMTAKISKRKVFVNYFNDGCVIKSFGMHN
ncbi:hypothetical protein [Colwellia sp. MB02u-14]|uniref:hypothetical protein n=1 Tax=Colwellia sp. MB02u-14 TaxID=2759815 RepID=UPI0015F60D20|nr:hypothetical protein [Colwellia sp. MB02u-14]MBA6302355.1 hypothetical protein [Colwellia sp. MB02u-14]